MAEKRRLGIRFWWEALQWFASGFLLLVLVVMGVLFVFIEALPWLGGGFADLGAGEASRASVVALLIASVALIVVASILVGFGAEIGQSFARRLLSKRT